MVKKGKLTYTQVLKRLRNLFQDGGSPVPSNIPNEIDENYMVNNEMSVNGNNSFEEDVEMGSFGPSPSINMNTYSNLEVQYESENGPRRKTNINLQEHLDRVAAKQKQLERVSNRLNKTELADQEIDWSEVEDIRLGLLAKIKSLCIGAIGKSNKKYKDTVDEIVGELKNIIKEILENYEQADKQEKQFGNLITEFKKNVKLYEKLQEEEAELQIVKDSREYKAYLSTKRFTKNKNKNGKFIKIENRSKELDNKLDEVAKQIQESSALVQTSSAGDKVNELNVQIVKATNSIPALFLFCIAGDEIVTYKNGRRVVKNEELAKKYAYSTNEKQNKETIAEDRKEREAFNEIIEEIRSGETNFPKRFLKNRLRTVLVNLLLPILERIKQIDTNSNRTRSRIENELLTIQDKINKKKSQRQKIKKSNKDKADKLKKSIKKLEKSLKELMNNMNTLDETASNGVNGILNKARKEGHLIMDRYVRVKQLLNAGELLDVRDAVRLAATLKDSIGDQDLREYLNGKINGCIDDLCDEERISAEHEELFKNLGEATRNNGEANAGPGTGEEEETKQNVKNLNKMSLSDLVRLADIHRPENIPSNQVRLRFNGNTGEVAQNNRYLNELRRRGYTLNQARNIVNRERYNPNGTGRTRQRVGIRAGGGKKK